VAADRGLSSFNHTQNFRASGVYMIPYRGGGIGRAVLGGWELTSIFTYLSGSPVSPASAASRVFTGSGSTTGRPNYVAGCNLYSGFQTINEWFNANCYSLQNAGTYGDAGRDTIIGPNLWDLDSSLIRDFNVRKISENLKVQFRAEAFNILNHPSFGNPSTTVFSGTAISATAGKITTNSSSPRQLQLGLKVVF
jgi:hypothetical protein